MTPDSLLVAIYIFVLATFVGVEVITKVPPLLHTPLMSGANAIAGIAIVGALVVTGPKEVTASSILGLIALIFASVNVFGGFVVTDRMLQMFKKGPGR